MGLTWDPLKDLLGLGKYLMRSPTGEGGLRSDGGETMRFSKMVGRTGFKKYINIYIYIYFYITGWLVFMQKRQNGIGFPLIRKEG